MSQDIHVEHVRACQHGANDATPFRANRTRLDHAAFQVAARNDIDAWATRLNDADIKNSGFIEIPMGARWRC